MRRAKVYNFGIPAGELVEIESGKNYKFVYHRDYSGSPISLTMPTSQSEYNFDEFPPFFEGLLPEGATLENLLRSQKIDRDDNFSQIVCVGKDLVGSVTVEELK